MGSTVCALKYNLTAAALLTHALLGCCWHHAHAAHQATAGTHAVEVCSGHHHGEPCGHHHPGPRAPADGDAPDRHGCDGSRCTFVTVPPVRTLPAPQVQPHEVVAIVPALDAGLPRESHVLAEDSVASGRLPPSDTRLMLQVFLL